MVKITCIDGPYAGQVRQLGLGGVEPEELFRSMLEHGWKWDVDYTSASPEEKFFWFRADLIFRCIRALMANKTVWYNKHEFTDPGHLEDNIVANDGEITLESDDKDGVVILLVKNAGEASVFVNKTGTLTVLNTTVVPIVVEAVLKASANLGRSVTCVGPYNFHCRMGANKKSLIRAINRKK